MAIIIENTQSQQSIFLAHGFNIIHRLPDSNIVHACVYIWRETERTHLVSENMVNGIKSNPIKIFQY
jgi:hypothetical protein